MKALRENAFITVDDYLEGEERSEVKHEYIGGQVHAMAGASKDHNRIAMNLASALGQRLKGTPCSVQMSDVKVHLSIADEEMFYYPDLMVTCDPRDSHPFFNQYPKVIIEVLSPTTEAIDRREKLQNYRRIEMLEEYALVAQDKMEVTVFRRANKWQPEIATKPEQALRLASLGFEMPMSAVYEDVRFS